MNALDWIAYILVFVGGINWGLVGIAQIDLVQAIFGAGNIANIIYILVGISALYMLFNMFMKK
jgi:uncharacterized membrane protein YuzA (DUF378 family)